MSYRLRSKPNIHAVGFPASPRCARPRMRAAPAQQDRPESDSIPVCVYVYVCVPTCVCWQSVYSKLHAVSL